MAMDKNKAQDILQKYHTGTCTEEEKALAEDWIIYGTAGEFDLTEFELLEDLLAIRQRLNLDATQTKTIRLWPRIVAAASILLFLSIGAYFVLHNKHPQQIAKEQKHDVAPGSNKAILTLANGHVIILNNARNGTIAQQGLASVSKKADGELVYNASAAKNHNAALQYNNITTPRGGQYHLILADGTNVWLNAASSIKYPTVFSGTERKVEITGEAYFEVAHNAAMPFRVTVNGQTVEVLGTHFNINAYLDEPSTKTTLLQGSVRITIADKMAMLKPGQQSQVTNHAAAAIKVIDDVDMDEAVAWKNGLFQFNNENLASIMRKVSRWYDVDITYADAGLQQQTFSGTVSRFKSASQLLKKLELTGAVHFKIEGQKIIVTN